MAVDPGMQYHEVDVLSVEAFERYGVVLENATSERRLDFEMPFNNEPNAVPRLWINRLQGYHGDSIGISVMECHPHAPQTFVPMIDAPYLVAVALPGDDGLPDMQTFRAYVSKGGEGVCYRRAVWHFAFTSLGSDNQVVVIMAGDGRDDTLIHTLAQPIGIHLSNWSKK
jgi:ureidoglycolate lyase